MALLACWECGREVSQHAASCPGCGAPRPADGAPPVTNDGGARLPSGLAAARRMLRVGAAIAAGVLVLGFVAGGALSDLAWAAVESLPLVVVALLARLGGGYRVAAWVVGVLAVALLFLGTFGAAFAVHGTLEPGAALRDPVALKAVGFGLLAAAALTFLTLEDRVRRALARVLPIDPANPVHALALFLVVALTTAPLASLLGTGEPLLLELLAASDDAELELTPASMMYGLVWLLPGAFVAAGYGIQRSADEAIDRLGLRWPGGKAVGLGALVGLALVPLVVGFDAVDDGLWRALGVPTTDEAKIEALFAGAMTPLGVVALALTAGVGEELSMRGLLQPRLGVLLTCLLFTSLHAFQYGLDGLVVVFALGLVFGLLRRQSGTVTAMTAHATYDLAIIVVGLAAS